MIIQLNGEEHVCDASVTTLQELIDSLGLGGKPLVAEVDRQAVLPGEHATKRIEDGARVELIMITAGG